MKIYLTTKTNIIRPFRLSISPKIIVLLKKTKLKKQAFSIKCSVSSTNLTLRNNKVNSINKNNSPNRNLKPKSNGGKSKMQSLQFASSKYAKFKKSIQK